MQTGIYLPEGDTAGPAVAGRAMKWWRLNRASKASPRVAIYCHRSPELAIERLRQTKIFRGDEISMFSFSDGFVEQVSKSLDRRNEMTLSRSDQTVYVGMNGVSFSSTILDRKINQ